MFKISIAACANVSQNNFSKSSKSDREEPNKQIKIAFIRHRINACPSG
jgi:hypothetical protein